MKKLIATVALLLMAPVLAPAQTEDHSSPIQGYFFFGPGVTNPPPAPAEYFFNPAPPNIPTYSRDVLVQTGLGGEALVYKGLGLDVEVGYAGPDWSFTKWGMGVGSADVSYHLLPKASKVEPFATGGYSLYFGHGRTNGLNFGGGVNIWLRRRAALRLEVRDQAHVMGTIQVVRHFVAFRIGLTFR